MWVKMQVRKRIEDRDYRPGDWANVDFELGRQWVMAKEAMVVNLEQSLPLGNNCGILLLGDKEQARCITDVYKKLKMRVGKKYSLPYEKTLIWQPDFELRPELLSMGFSLLDRWQMVAPVKDNTDVVIMTFDERLIFVKRDEATEELFKQANKTTFQQALSSTIINILALPEIWMK